MNPNKRQADTYFLNIVIRGCILADFLCRIKRIRLSTLEIISVPNTVESDNHRLLHNAIKLIGNHTNAVPTMGMTVARQVRNPVSRMSGTSKNQ